MKVVAADHDEDIRVRPRQGLAERLDLGDPFVGERRPVRSGRGASPEIKRMMRRCDDRRDLGLGAPRVSLVVRYTDTSPDSKFGSRRSGLSSRANDSPLASDLA